ncbi:MAG: ferredoxin-type protein NapG [Psychromonas sp.]|jgi:ferredoxin-type protein NapG|uniref:ferredoxin-type protein NapG n=1 Tax=Psychromonas sp. TaxID=1884585 RepID=UPI0039E36CB0
MSKGAQRKITRRQFLVNTSKGACGVGFMGLGLAGYSNQSLSFNPQMLRPPGALAEPDFQSACIRCGLCVEACPYDMLKLGRLFQPIATGTPYFIAREASCEMCDDIPCKAACPTGALDPELNNIDDARMGLAVLIDQENCLNFQGLRCDVCYGICPLIDDAITLEMHRNQRTGHHAVFIPTVHSDFCTGCGKCEEACVLEKAAIKVLPRSIAKGELGHHYRWGWKEKEKAGGSLIDPVLDLPDRLPEVPK